MRRAFEHTFHGNVMYQQRFSSGNVLISVKCLCIYLIDKLVLCEFFLRLLHHFNAISNSLIF